MSEPEVVKRDKEDYVNLTRSEAQNHYRTESTKEEKKKPKEQSAANKVSDFFQSKFFSWFYHYFRSRCGPRHAFLNYKTQVEDKGIYKLEKTSSADEPGISIALVGDWGTDTTESDRIGALIGSYETDYSIHLGDIYFVGMKDEIAQNFFNENCSWYRGTTGSFSIMGNHEMYSRGISFYRDLLPTLGVRSKTENKYLGQKAAFFCLENDHWRIIGLDTGYNSVGIPLIEYIFKPRCDLHNDILEWLDETLNLKNDKRGIIFLTHHQYCSAFEEEYKKTAEQLAALIGEDRKVLWYWGHEHRMAVYGKYKRDKGITAYGRCIGHGGMPVEFKDKLKTDKAEECNLVLYDERKNTEIKNIDIGFNGFVILNINEAELTAEYYDIHNELLLKEVWTADNQSGEIKGKEIGSVSKDITLYTSDIRKAIE
ncbi:MAG: metallophosphoesterase [Ignavibacteria bacterium]